MKKWLTGVAGTVIAGVITAIILNIVLNSANVENNHEKPPTNQYTLSIYVIPQDAGTITLSPLQPEGGYEEGTKVTLTANANTGYEFDKWSGAISGSPIQATLTMISNQSVTANFNVMRSIVGTIYYGLKDYGMGALAQYTNEDAVIWLRDIEGSTLVYPDYHFDTQTSEFIIEGVSPGKYSLVGWIDCAPPFGTHKPGETVNFDSRSPGDFTSFLSGWSDEVVVTPNSNVVYGDIEVAHEIHLIEPFDNQEIRNLEDFPMKLYHYQSGYGPSAATFEWEPVPGATSYDVWFVLRDGNNNVIDSVHHYPTSNKLSPNLDVTTGSNYYILNINAYRDTNLLGTLCMVYTNAWAGGFKFTVAPRP